MKKVVIANWKLNPASSKEAVDILDSCRAGIKSFAGAVVVCPPLFLLPDLIKKFKESFVWGAQDCFWEKAGPFTGEISPKVLRSYGVDYVLLGHSERRRYLHETDEMVGKKVKAAARYGLVPMICLGGGLDKEAGGRKIRQVLRNQFRMAVRGLKKSPKIVIAYEPTHAISTTGGSAVTPAHAQAMSLFIRSLVARRWSKAFAGRTPVIYGGSVDSTNAGKFWSQPDIDGLLVGAASLSLKEFLKILQSAVF